VSKKTTPTEAIEPIESVASTLAATLTAPAEIATTEPSAGTALEARHPNLGLAPIDMSIGFPLTASRLQREAATIAARALENLGRADPTLMTRHDEVGLRRLLRDGELLVERLAMCLGSDNVRWLTEYAEWIGPVYRRRRITLSDLAALCAAIEAELETELTPDERACAARGLEAAALVLRRNGRLAGDPHERNELLKWMYKGV
jgi:hypothetical protein